MNSLKRAWCFLFHVGDRSYLEYLDHMEETGSLCYVCPKCGTEWK